MRVLLTTDTVGGVWTFTRELAEGLLDGGCSVAMVSFGRRPSEDQERWASFTTSRWQERFLFVPSEIPLEWMPGNDEVRAPGVELLLQVAREFCPDLLHSSQFCWGDLPLQLPRVVTAHSDVLSWADACSAEALEPSPWLARYNELVQLGLSGADAVVAPTRWMMDALATHFALPPRQRVIANGRTPPAAVGDGERTLQAVTAGRLWDRAKNLHLLCELEQPPLPILVAGDESFSSGKRLTTDSQVQSLGELTETELFRLFEQSAIYIACSRYEPFGLAPLEAALCGCAVVANDIPSLREVWGEAAIYFSGPSSLNAVLLSLVQDFRGLAAARERSRKRALEFPRAAMVRAYLQLYRELLADSASQHLLPCHEEAHVA